MARFLLPPRAMHFTSALSLSALAFVSAVTLATARPARAQDIQRFQPSPGVLGHLTTAGAGVAGDLQLVPSLWVDLARDPLVERDAKGNVDTRIVGRLVTAHVQAVFGVANRFEAGLDVPTHFSSGTGLAGRGGDVTTLGDVRVIPKVRLFGLEKWRDDGLGLAVLVPVSLPTGPADDFLGEGQVTVGPRLAGQARYRPVSVTADVGFLWRPATKKFQSLDVGNAVTYAGGIGVDLGMPQVVGYAEVFGAAPAGSVRDDSRSKPLEGLLGMRWFSGFGLVSTVGAGRGIIADYGAPDWRAFLGLAYVHRAAPKPDTDKDGVPDATDGCPSEPEDRDGYDDADGCPDPDNDHDGVYDDRDRCPNKAETNPRAADADGCPDVTVDTDGDGIEDQADKCPQEREDNDDWADDDGCPEWDNDKDGFKDDADACPFQAEVINGVDDQDGCPDQTPTAKVRVTADKIEILEKVYFETGKDIIKPQSYGILDQVAAVMKSRADLKTVQVEGHTDNQGPDPKNLKLSQKRAEAVRSYLIREGVAPDRLQAKGFGETLPIDTNGTEPGRANNRRVEFRILSGPGGGGVDLIE